MIIYKGEVVYKLRVLIDRDVNPLIFECLEIGNEYWESDPYNASAISTLSFKGSLIWPSSQTSINPAPRFTTSRV